MPSNYNESDFPLLICCEEITEEQVEDGPFETDDIGKCFVEIVVDSDGRTAEGSWIFPRMLTEQEQQDLVEHVRFYGTFIGFKLKSLDSTQN